MVSTVQIYDPRGELTFKLTTKPPPLPKPTRGPFGSLPFGSSASRSPLASGTAASSSTGGFASFGASQPSSNSLFSGLRSPAPSATGSSTAFGAAGPLPTRGLFGATGTLNFPNLTTTSSSSPARQNSAGLFGEQAAPAPKPDDEVKIEEVEMLVSSSQMCLVSPVFNAMLQHKFVEGETLREHGKVIVPLPDDEPVAFAILMKIIHAQNNLVPTQIDLHTLTNIAILVDKYRLHDCTSVFASMWIEALRSSISRISAGDNKEIICWLSITCVFNRPWEFKMVTMVAQKYLSQPSLEPAYGLGFDDLLLPENVIARIEEKRQKKKTIHDALTNLQNLVSELLGGPAPFGSIHPPPRRCTRRNDDCESMLLGSLLRSVKAQFLWPINPSLRLFMDTTTLAQKLRGLKVQSECAKLHSVSPGSETHGVAETIAEIVRAVEGSHLGLNLRDFQRDSSAEPQEEL